MARASKQAGQLPSGPSPESLAPHRGQVFGTAIVSFCITVLESVFTDYCPQTRQRLHGGRGQSCIFFELVLAKTVRTDPDASFPQRGEEVLQLLLYLGRAG